MTQSPADPPTTIWWGLRHYHWLAIGLAAVVLIITDGLAIRQQTAEPHYEATALIIAGSLAHDPAQLPRLAEALLAKDSVADDAIRAGALPWDAQTLRERHVKLTPLENNVLIEVTGRAQDPTLAAGTANAVADSLAEALNRPGRGLGVFAIQHRATPPTQQADDGSLWTLLVGGLLAAILLPIGMIALLLAIRRPLSNPAEAATAVGVPAIGVLWMRGPRHAIHHWTWPPWRRATVAPTEVPGLHALARAAFPDDKGGCLLSAPEGAGGTRTAVFAWLVRAMADRGEVAAVPARKHKLPVDLQQAEQVTTLERPVEQVSDHPPAVIDGFDVDGMPARQLVPDGARGVLVVPEGSPRARTVNAAEQFAEGELIGIVFVRQ